MKMKKLMVLIIGTMLFLNLHAGLYQIRSRVPHSITLSRRGKIMSEEKAVEELSKSVTIEEANKGRVFYSLDQNNELVLSFMTKNEEKREFKTISLEVKDE